MRYALVVLPAFILHACASAHTAVPKSAASTHEPNLIFEIDDSAVARVGLEIDGSGFAPFQVVREANVFPFTVRPGSRRTINVRRSVWTEL